MDATGSPHGHDIIVIGASSGGVRVLQRIMADLPHDLPAAVFVVMHLGLASHLAPILDRAGKLPVVSAESGAPIRRGHVHVAPPGRHLLLHDGHLMLRRGPHENLARPAIDPLFRSAAATFGGRVIGVVLSGALNDGTAGLNAVKRCGGIAVVQEPDDAAVPEMPRSALRTVAVDHCLPGNAIGALLARLALLPAGQTPSIPFDIRLESAIAAQEIGDMATQDGLGEPSRFTCPECHGTLWEIDDGGLRRYRCHVGHAFTGEAMLAAQTRQIERTLWSLMRSHTERAVLVRRLAAQETSPGRAAELLRRAAETERDAELVRQLVRERATTAIAEGPEDDTG
jgi:two-component system chemotaxis response regulator CheB